MLKLVQQNVARFEVKMQNVCPVQLRQTFKDLQSKPDQLLQADWPYRQSLM